MITSHLVVKAVVAIMNNNSMTTLAHFILELLHENHVWHESGWCFAAWTLTI